MLQVSDAFIVSCASAFYAGALIVVYRLLKFKTARRLKAMIQVLEEHYDTRMNALELEYQEKLNALYKETDETDR